MVVHSHTICDINLTTLSSLIISLARRFTRFNSVPTNHFVPDSASLMVFKINSVDPTISELTQTSKGDSGCEITIPSGFSSLNFLM